MLGIASRLLLAELSSRSVSMADAPTPSQVGVGPPHLSSLSSLASVKAPEPLAVSYPSVTLLLQYPLIAANVRVFCDKDSFRSRGNSSLATGFVSINKVYKQEGVFGVYRGAHLYLMHQAVRDVLRMLAERTIRWVEGAKEDQDERQEAKPSSGGGGGPPTSIERRFPLNRPGYRWRLAAKYLIDSMCYPIILASTRYVILYGEGRSTWDHMCQWRLEEGLISLFSGLAASLLSSALDEVMDNVLEYCIDYCASDSEIDLADKLLLKGSGSSVVSILTSPVNYIGIIQRCQSRITGLLDPQPLPELVCTLPWRGTLYQFVIFGGIMALNVRLVQWKIQLQREQDQRERDGPPLSPRRDLPE